MAQTLPLAGLRRGVRHFDRASLRNSPALISLAIAVGAACCGYLIVRQPTVLFAVALGLPASILVIRDVRLGLLVFIPVLAGATFLKRFLYALVPASAVSVDNNPVTLVPLLLVGLLAVGTLLSSKERDGVRLRAWLASPVHVFIILFVLLAVVESLNPGTSLGIAAYGFAASYGEVLMCIVALLFPWNRAYLERFASIVALVSIMSAVYGLWQGVHGMTSWEQAWFNSEFDSVAQSSLFVGGHLRIFSTFNNTTVFTSFLVFGIAFTLARVIMAQSRGQYILWSAGLSMQFGALFLTFVKSAWIALAVGLAVLFFVSTVTKTVKVVGGLIGLVSLLGFVVSGGVQLLLASGSASPSSTALQQVGYALDPRVSPTFELRILTVRSLLQYIVANPAGYGTGTAIRSAHAYVPGLALYGNGIESDYVRAALELGIPGVLVLTLTIVGTIVVAVRLVRRSTVDDPVLRWSAMAALMTVVSLAVMAFTSIPLATREGASVFWLCVGLLLKLASGGFGVSGQRTRSSRDADIAATGLEHDALAPNAVFR